MKGLNCPQCNGKNIIRYGRYGDRQVYYCKDCKKKFIEKGLKNKDPKVIINAITYYNLGNTLEESAKLVNRRFKVKTSNCSFLG
jgi:transposase-like protein